MSPPRDRGPNFWIVECHQDRTVAVDVRRCRNPGARFRADRDGEAAAVRAPDVTEVPVDVSDGLADQVFRALHPGPLFSLPAVALPDDRRRNAGSERQGRDDRHQRPVDDEPVVLEPAGLSRNVCAQPFTDRCNLGVG